MWRDGDEKPRTAVQLVNGAVLTVRLPMAFKRRGGRKLILVPNGAGGLAAKPPRPDGTALRTLPGAWAEQRRALLDGDGG